MSTIRARLQQLEKVTGAARAGRVFVHYSDDDFYTCNGEKLTRSEYDRISTDDDLLIEVGGIGSDDL